MRNPAASSSLILFTFWPREGHRQESRLQEQPRGDNPAVIGCSKLKGTFRGGKTQKERLREKPLRCAADRTKLQGFSLLCPHAQYHQLKKKPGAFTGHLHQLTVAEDFSLLLQESQPMGLFSLSPDGRLQFWQRSSAFVALPSPNFSSRG